NPGSRRISRHFWVVLVVHPFTVSLCLALAWHVPEGVPSETRGSPCLNLCLIVTFSNPLRPYETSALRQDAGWIGASRFRTTQPAGPSDRVGQVPWRDILPTVGSDRAGLGIYLFGGICKKPQHPRSQMPARQMMRDLDGNIGSLRWSSSESDSH